MALTIAPVAALPAGSSLTTALSLQPGTVVDARVLQILESGLTRILIAGVALDVASTANLTAGTNVQLAVSQTPQGVQLAVVGQGAQAAASASSSTYVPSNSGSVTSAQSTAVSLGNSASSASSAGGTQNATTITSLASSPTVAVVDQTSAEPSPAAILRSVVASVTESAASRQTSIAPLFAEVDAVASTRVLPADVAVAATRLLALRPDLDTSLKGDDIKAAFKNSGLFLESTIKTAVVTGSPAPSATTPDLKAALLVMRQVLSMWSDASLAETTPTQSPVAQIAPQTAAEAVTNAPSAAESAQASAASTANVAVSANLAQPVTEVAGNAQPNVPSSSSVQPSGPQTSASPLDETLATTPLLAAQVEAAATEPTGAIAALQRTMMLKAGETVAGELTSVSDAPSIVSDVAPRNATQPPPPWRGAAPSAQPIASPTLSPLAPDSNVVRTLLQETDAALARQTLHQIASLPDGLDAKSVSTATDPLNASTAPRWSFEIPFATPQGTAVAQFEISGEGGSETPQASIQKIWRARFTINVDSTGPVHAHLAMIAQPNAQPKTSVRLWAERPDTQTRLQAGADQLAQALRSADLEPETIIIGEGKPAANTVPSGRFLNRAS